MLRIALCDDEVNARDALQFQLEKVLHDSFETIAYEFSSGKRAVSWLAKHPGEIDLLFLDVEMDEMNGMEALEIRKFNQDIIIAFLTGYTDYAFDGYKVNALDYIVKPATLERIENLIERVRSLIAEQSQSYFVFQNVDGTFKTRLKDVLYFYSDKRLVHVVTSENKYAFYGKLDQVEERLSDLFVRIHQRYLVNAPSVSKISSKRVEVSGEELPISRALKEMATAKLAKAMLGNGF